MSKRKADFDTPEKENKRPKTSGTPSAVRSYRDEVPSALKENTQLL